MLQHSAKALVTGHTSGLGLGIYEALQERKIEVVGLSRSTGYDVASQQDKILDLAKGATIFVNNAYAGFYNVTLLYKLFELWKTTDNLIVNISSDSGNGTKDFPHIYAVAKSALDKACEQLQNCSGGCRIINIRPSYIDTPRVANVDAQKLSVREMTDVILWCISQPPNVYIQNIQLKARHRSATP